MINQALIINPCHKCTNGTCPCESYKDYLDHLFRLFRQDVAEGTQEINEIMDEIRTDSPSPILQGEGGAKGNV